MHLNPSPWTGSGVVENILRFIVATRGSVLRCPMNILVENNDTLEYLASAGRWTKNPRDGKCFPATRTAFMAAKQEAIGKFNIVRHFPATGQFINLDHGRGAGGPAAAISPGDAVPAR